MKITTRNTLIGGGFVLAAALITVAAMFLTKGPTHNADVGGTDNVTSAGQSGGITGKAVSEGQRGGITADKVTINLNPAAAPTQLPVTQRIDAIQNDNSILLDYDPIPETIKIIVGPLVHFPRPNYGYKLDGRKIFITHDQTLKQVEARILSGGVTVEYMRNTGLDTKTQQ